ncbi:uncharacterized protein BX663DRAFT_533786 [Cokeromyces recurvatus]|uniref:uncharacterized protein n=1 Tax=Cokeromyces recurvatus TaxID=90255 RepID=UPI00221F061D|nr:uncharacterized protein BX663DRAFT_533786 [Cokeromyces recurvatus]KAI7897516.1 hypothetical protein BX663DRAFT_533786 [Cokeromyces recurvatus]
MKAVVLDEQVGRDLHEKFMVPAVNFPNVDQQLQSLMKKITSLRGKYNLYIITSLKFDGDIRKKFEILTAIYKSIVFKMNDAYCWKTMSEWSNTKHNNFRVNLRLCRTLKVNNYDISNIEFKKNGIDSRSVKENEGKVRVEGKTILNCFSQHYNLDFSQGQENQGDCRTYSINEKMTDTFIDKPQQLFMFKDEILKEVENLKELLQDNSIFGSQSTIKD